MMITIYTQCPYCGKETPITVDEKEYLKWQSGELIQNAMPLLTPAEREMLITGICQECWDEMYKDYD